MGTDTKGGTVTALLLLVSVTGIALPLAALLNVTVHVSVLGPINEEFAQLSPVSEGTVEAEPLPCSLTAPARFTDVPVFDSTLSWPVESVAEPGS